MGDRALVIFTHGEDISPVVYLHWDGSRVPQYLKELATLMATRRGDASYAAARFIGLCHTKIDGNLSLGVWNLPPEQEMAVKLKDQSPIWATRVLDAYSHGDAGVVIVDADSFAFTAYGGYLAEIDVAATVAA